MRSRNHCGVKKQQYFLICIVADVNVSVNNVKVFIVTMEKQERPLFTLLLRYKIFRSAGKNINVIFTVVPCKLMLSSHLFTN